MNCEKINETANHIITRYGTTDPFELCANMGVNVRYTDLGSLKGMYKYIKRNLSSCLSIKMGIGILQDHRNLVSLFYRKADRKTVS